MGKVDKSHIGSAVSQEGQSDRQTARQAEDRLTAEVTVGQITINQISSPSFAATLLPFSGAPTEKERGEHEDDNNYIGTVAMNVTKQLSHYYLNKYPLLRSLPFPSLVSRGAATAAAEE